ncbi:hypothetical protein GCM10027451_06960 [Geodermatophilus aquaeductus]|uniref:Uncharacterized protein n=1 Tax=Geodermatophilus aquaeductus TaxID=1564161 RepID=A0A521DD25_9ACTN|nr:hypothetical protein [Geodermatophilus aquaeductus]SMO69051.1 hypothetical protein SAMN06273567_10352 [Geodermatophilus aquaeductus]
MTEPAVPAPVPTHTAPPNTPPTAPAPAAGVSTAPPTAPVTVPGSGPGGAGATATGAGPASPGTAAPAPGGSPGTPSAAVVESGQHPTGPVAGRPPVVRPRRTDPLTRMGPWAPVAGAVVGLVAGLVALFLLRSRADAFAEGLALVFLVVGLTMLGAAGALLADEVRLVRRGAREAAVRPAWVEATAGLINGLTPARLLLGSSAFVLFLAAYVSR